MKTVEYEGKQYRSIRQLCEEQHIDYDKTIKKIRSGFTISEAVSCVKKGKYEAFGQHYSTQRELAEGLGIPYRIFLQSSAYKELRNKVARPKNPICFRGVTYDSKSALYEALGVSGSAIRKYAINHGLSTGQALKEIADKRFGQGLGAPQIKEENES